MGIYLNPGNRSFQISLNSKIYIDKSNLISYTNSVINTPQRFICVSCPRRFGKSVTAEMLAAYTPLSLSLMSGTVFSENIKMTPEHRNYIWIFSAVC